MRAGVDVVAAWGAGNAVLLGVHFYYGGGVGGSIPLALYGGSVLLTELIAVAAWVTLRARPDVRVQTPAPRSSRIAFWGGWVALFVIAGFVYRPWMMLLGIYPALGVVLEFVSSRRAVRREMRPVNR